MESKAPSLNSLFDQSEELFHKLENSSLSSTDEKFQNDVKKALANFKIVATFVDRHNYFSSNEELADIHTSLLRYLLLNHYIGLLYLKLVDANRVGNLKQAKACLQGFLMQCENLQLVHKEDLASVQREKNARVDAKQKRDEKISRAKRDKEARAKLQELALRQKSRNTNEDEDDDEEHIRDARLTQIEIAVRKTIEELEATDQEIEMLEQIEKLKIQNGGILKPQQPSSQKPVFQNFILMPSNRAQREELRKKVFNPTNLPTMTVEEWAELQIANGLLPDPSQQQQQQEKKKNVVLSEEEEEAKRIKDSRFDDWKDENPRGEGNKNDNYFKR